MKELLILRDESPTSQYVPKNRPGQHDHDYIFKSGQRKLLVSEINFLTNYSHLSNTVLYIGASPGIHLNTLIKLFPNIKNWIFYDIHEIKQRRHFSGKAERRRGQPIRQIVENR